jgi:ubiquinone biosynthesis protein
VADTWQLPGSRLSRRLEIYGTAARVFGRYGRLRLPGAPRPGSLRAEALDRAHETGARALYETAVHLRGGFLKLGQFVSARPDLLPEPYVTELSKLQDRVPPAPAATIARVIADDVAPVEALFSSFDAESASAASLAQVHRAIRTDGRPVAVKVQYPGVKEIVPAEMGDTARILKLIDRVVSSVDLGTISDALARVVLEELDYVNEAANLERFAANFADEPDIVVPAVHRDISHGRVLVMDWVEGENLGRALRTCDHETASEAARLLVDSYLKQILVDGFLHADPHPGNFLLQPGPKLGFVDFGACSAISDPTRMALRDLYRSGLEQDPSKAAEALEALGFRTRSGDLGSLVAWVSLFDSSEVGENREQAWKRLTSAARDDPVVKLPDELIMVGRVLMVQTGLVARIKPDWSMDDLLAARLGDT